MKGAYECGISVPVERDSGGHGYCEPLSRLHSDAVGHFGHTGDGLGDGGGEDAEGGQVAAHHVHPDVVLGTDCTQCLDIVRLAHQPSA